MEAVGPVLGLAGSIAQGVIGNNAASEAAAAGQKAAQQSNQVAQQVYQTNEGNLNPYIQTGTNAQGTLSSLLSGGAAGQSAFDQFKNSSNYNFLLNQGEQGIAYGNAPQYNSSATEKSLNNYAQGMAGNALQSYEGMLQGLGQTGAQSASTLGSLGNQYSNQFASNTFGGANAQEQGILGGAAATQNALGNVTQSTSFANPFGGQTQNPSVLANLAGGISSFAKNVFQPQQTVGNTQLQSI